MIFGSWKYILKNLWFVLPFAIVPAAFLALSVDYHAIRELTAGIFAGNSEMSFFLLFRSLSVIRVDGWVGALIGVGTVFACAVFAAVMLSLVEKHMRIGKRTVSGAFSQLGNNLFSSLGITLLYGALYELWALVSAAVLYAIGGLVKASVGAWLLSVLAFLGLSAVLLFCITVFYLWLPCLQLTGFRPYEALRYSYQLVVNVRGRLLLTLIAEFLCVTLVCALAGAFLPYYWMFLIVMFIAFALLFLSFCIRMEIVYFKTDKLDREDLIRSYRGLL